MDCDDGGAVRTGCESPADGPATETGGNVECPPFLATLKKLPPHTSKKGVRTEYWIGGAFKLVPFRFRNVTYILMVTPGLEPQYLPGRRKFSVVVKYTPAFALQDICYIEEVRRGKRGRGGKGVGSLFS